MTIDYFAPFSKAWTRMNQALFKPFNLTKWFALGFTAFLAELADGSHTNSAFNWKRDRFGWNELYDWPQRAWDWITSNPGWLFLIIFGAGLLLLIVILLTWLSSRGKFMFLDNVIHDRALIAAPWHEYRNEGNSLFIWRLLFGLASLAVFALLALFYFMAFRQIFVDDFSIGNIVSLAIPVLILIFLIGYISLFLNHFVVPIMYKRRINTMQAWGKFLSLLNEFPVQFILFGIIMFFLYVLFMIAIVLIGIFTCCCGLLLVALPYIGSVVTLPVSYTFRAYSLDFLEQFGPDYKLFPEAEPVE